MRTRYAICGNPKWGYALTFPVPIGRKVTTRAKARKDPQMTTATDLPTLNQQMHGRSAGWYPDPWYPDRMGPASWLRYWDGIEWTATTALTVHDDPLPEETATV